jgi:hypothetical protein
LHWYGISPRPCSRPCCGPRRTSSAGPRQWRLPASELLQELLEVLLIFQWGWLATMLKTFIVSIGAKAKTPPFARDLRRSRWPNGDKTTGRYTLRPIRHRTKTRDEVILPPCGLVQHGGPRVIRPIVTGPAWPLRVTGQICKSVSVITVCNPALWEYSGDNLGV